MLPFYALRKNLFYRKNRSIPSPEEPEMGNAEVIAYKYLNIAQLLQKLGCVRKCLLIDD